MKRPYLLLALGLWLGGLVTAPAAVGQTSISVDKRNGTSRHIWETPTHRLEILLEGEVTFTDDDSGIAELSRDGYLEIDERSRSERRRLDVEPGPDGTLQYTYRVGRQEQPFDAEGRAWLADILPQVIRETGIGAEQRTARLLAQEGVGGVLDEIALINSSGSKTRYCLALLDQATLNAGELDDLASEIKEIPSSGDKTRVLIHGMEAYMEAGAYHVYFDAVDAIPSSGDKTRVLLHLLDHDAFDDRTALTEALKSASNIPSSGDRSRVLIAAAPRYTNDAPLREAYFDAVRGIPSSGDKTRVLLALLEKDDFDTATITAFFETAESIQSSGDKARFLTAAAPYFANDAAVRQTFFDAVNTIPSSGDHSGVLVALLQRNQLDKAALLALFDSAEQIASSGDKTRVLLEAADRVGSDDDLAEAYFRVAESIPSSGDRRRALSALVQ